jgi:uncharacterized protein YutE (UPF0331/DUF86 family)
MAVLNLAQSVELHIKAALVEKNVSIYEKGGRTVNTYDALSCLAKLWDVERIAYHARVELLIDERNAIQHRYGSVDDVSLDYHMETAFGVVREILEREFDTVLDTWVRDTVEDSIWKKIRFVQADTGVEEPSAASQPERSPTLDFIDGFSRFERSIRALIQPFLHEGERFSGSTLDLAIKALSNSQAPNNTLIQRLPGVYRLRNKTIHGDEVPDDQEVIEALITLDDALKALSTIPEEVLERAYRASMRGVKGTKLPTRSEEAQEDFNEPLPPAPPPEAI